MKTEGRARALKREARDRLIQSFQFAQLAGISKTPPFDQVLRAWGHDDGHVARPAWQDILDVTDRAGRAAERRARRRSPKTPKS